jgi:hypothetical protein
MRECNNPNFLGLDLIDDAVRETPQGEATRSATPNRSEARIAAEDREGALELSDECQAELSIRFSCVEKGSVN